MTYPGMIFVASTDGTVYALDAESREITGEYTVGPASSSGYSSMVFSPSEGTAYLIGAMGSILELSMPDCEVLDEFQVCPTPFALEVGDGATQCLWVADAQSNTVYQLKLSNNQKIGSIRYPEEAVVQCMEASPGRDTLLVGTSFLLYRVEILNGVTLRNTYIPNLTFSAISISAIPNTDSYIAASSGSIGQLNPFGYSQVPPLDPYVFRDDLPGALHMTDAANDDHHMIALSYLGDGVSRFSSYNFIGPMGIDNTAEFEGYPLDFHVSGEGNIYVLTY